MSKEGRPELTKSWVFIDSEKSQNHENSGVEEIVENEPHGDSDSDSISVISESGCSYKTDEDESPTTEMPSEKQIIEEDGKFGVQETQPIAEEKPELFEDIETFENDKKLEKLLYFGTSAACAIILVAISIAVQQYFQGTSELDTFNSDQQFTYSHVRTKPEDLKKSALKRKNQFNLNDVQNKVAKIEDNDINDKIAEDNDPRVERKFKSNYKLNKNKNVPTTCNKENCDLNGKTQMDQNNNNENNRPNDEDCDEKIQELKIKEDYLREKEKFLIEKEHDLLKQEIKLNKVRNDHLTNKHDKKNSFKKTNEFEEADFADKKETIRKKHGNNVNYKKYNSKKDYKKIQTTKRYKISNEEEKKHNISGQWYINLHEARDNMRQRKRASFKRNKAHWYFQWMVDRARLRVK